MDTRRWFATCPKGLEGLLKLELESLGADQCRETVAGCHFEGPLALGYRACLWSRLANRILMPLAEVPVANSEQLHKGLLQLPWLDYVAEGASLLVDFSGTDDEIRNTQYGAQVCKDAIVDALRDAGRERPQIARKDPDLRVNVRLRKGAVVVAIDFGGCSLHQRGYRLEAGQAPIKENLACALLLRADWPGIAAAGGALIDPMCGSGTLLLEAAMMVADIAPGLRRTRWGFESLPFHNRPQWQAIVADADARAERGKARQWPEIRGYDADPVVIAKAQANIERAGLSTAVRVRCKALGDLKKPSHRPLSGGLVITNPPYGERLGEKESLRYLYKELGDAMVREFSGWRGAVLTSDPDLGHATALHSHKRYALFNGTLPSGLLLFELGPDIQRKGNKEVADAGTMTQADLSQLGAGARMFANRIRKNMKNLRRWVRREGVQCYRIYDADMPEYAVAVDLYGDALHVAEYRAPANIPQEDTDRRMADVAAALPLATGVQPQSIHYKQRMRQRGKQQYEQLERRGDYQTVQEGDAKLLVNLSDYLDTGLFLDHRPLRLRIGAQAKGAHVLNLFCYTAAASVHAALGGARSTTSVDLSRTYLDWARKNFAANGFGEQQHRLIQADCLQWLREEQREYDLILLDPPSFSNSKRMQDHFDVQRDHPQIIELALARLARGGTLYFSNNLRSFKLDPEVAGWAGCEDISRQTLDEDFKRRPQVHQCWRFKAQPAAPKSRDKIAPDADPWGARGAG